LGVGNERKEREDGTGEKSKGLGLGVRRVRDRIRA
jgi:hypothetical protein